MEQPVIEPKLLSDTEIETRYGIDRATLQRWRLKHYGPPFIKTKGRVFYDRADIDAWLEANKRRSTSGNGGAA